MTPQEKATLEMKKLKASLMKAKSITDAIVKNVKETIEIIDKINKLRPVFLITILGSYSFFM